ncbi:hypothetical protein PMIN06_004773 [Paraphaeosphaeria minitans]
MRASLIFLITSFTASAVAAPVASASPIESPEPLMVRDADADAISPILENLKREVLERLDVIAQQSTPNEDVSDEIEKRTSTRPYLGSSAGKWDKRTSTRPYQGSSAGKWDKRTSTRSYQGSSAGKWDKRTSTRPYQGSSAGKWDKRTSTRPYQGSSAGKWDKREEEPEYVEEVDEFEFDDETTASE